MKIELVARACPLCASMDTSHVFAEAAFDPNVLDEFAFASRKLPEYMHYRLISCPTCHLVYANPLPTLKMLASAYEEAAFDSNEEARFASLTYATFLPQIIQKLPDQIGALDIGTGDGVFLEHLLDNGFRNVLGVEPSSAPIAQAGERVKPLIRQGLFRVEDFTPEQFSLITCFQTIEHLYDPLAMCRDAYTLLKPGGALYYVCHNLQSVSAKLLRFKSPIFDIEHLQLFSPPSAQYMLDKCGFTDIKIEMVVNQYPLSYLVKLFPFPPNQKRKLLASIKASPIGSKQLSLPLGNMALIAYKPHVC